MSGSGNSGEESDTPWDDFLSDFTLVVDTGECIKCHKLVLAKSSPVLTTMLQTDMVEAKTNQMKISGHDLETVIAFLEYIYSNMNMFDFDQDKYKIKLLRLAHQYQVEALIDDCVDFLSRTITMKTAMEIWSVAEELDIERMKFSTESMSRLMVNANGFQVLKCGTCKRTTEKPAVQCKCCGYLTVLKTNKGNDKTKVSYKFPGTG